MSAQRTLHTIKYLQIAREIEAEIRKCKIQPESPVYSVRDIMKKWHVSSQSAQQALKLLENRGLIFRVPRKGCFVKSCKRIKSVQKKFKVGYSIYETLSDFKLDRLIRSPEEELIDILESRHCNLKYLSNSVFRDPVAVHRELKGMDGLIVSAVNVNLLECSALFDLKIPAIAIHGDVLLDLPFHQVLPDPMSGLRAMFQCAKKFHPDHIIIVSHNHPNGLARAESCRKTAEEFGIRNISSFVFSPGDNAYNKAKEIVPLLNNTLVFVCSCMIAFPFLNAFSDEKRIRPSEDYHLVCYDDIETIGVMPRPVPTMTTIGYSHDKIVRMGAEILLDEMNKPSGFIKKILVPTSLTIRKSGLCDADTYRKDSV